MCGTQCKYVRKLDIMWNNALDVNLIVTMLLSQKCTRNSPGDEIANVNFLYEAYYAVQGHRRLPSLVPIESS